MSFEQEVFDVAYDSYLDAEGILMKLTLTARSANRKFDVVDPIYQYDTILQSILVQVMVADGVISEEELAFIDALSDHVDVLHEIGLQLGINVTWRDLPALGSDNINAIISICKSLAEDTAYKLAAEFAPIDALTEENFIDELDACTSRVLGGLMAIDGQIDENEIMTGYTGLKELLTGPWQECKEMTEAELLKILSEDNTSPKQ